MPMYWITRITTDMRMHNPPHPGEFITEVYLEPFGISGRELAEKLDVAPSTLREILQNPPACLVGVSKQRHPWHP